MADILTSKASPGAVPEGYKDLFDTLKKAFEDGNDNDLIIRCDGREWAVHKMVVCRRSEFFRACCKNFLEAAEGIIDLPDDNKFAVAALLSYLYTADYDDELAVEDSPPVLHNVRVHTIADKYGVTNLCQLAEAKFRKRANAEWKSDGFAEAIKELYVTAPGGKQALQDIAAAITVKHAKELYGSQESQFFKAAQKIAPFSAQVMSGVIACNGKFRAAPGKFPEQQYICASCDASFTTTLITEDCFYCPGCGDTNYIDMFGTAGRGSAKKGGKKRHFF